MMDTLPMSKPDRYPNVPAEPAKPAKRPTLEPAPPQAEAARARPPLAIYAAIGAIVAATLGVIVYSVYVYLNPFSPLNIFPPATPLPIIITATFLPATSTEAVPLELRVTPTPLGGSRPTATLILPTAAITPTLPGGAQIIEGTLVIPASTPIPTGLPTVTPTFSPYPLRLSADGVSYLENDNGRGCTWASIAGNIVNQAGTALNGLGVKITDTTSGDFSVVYSGSAPTFGAGGFEFALGEAPLINAYLLQVVSAAGAPLSAEYQVITSDRCTQNIARVRFEQVQPF